MCDSKPSITRPVGFDVHFLTRCHHNGLVVLCNRCDLPLKGAKTIPASSFHQFTGVLKT